MRTAYSLRQALALIDQSRCPCAGCNGRLGSSEYPSWRRCPDCRCSWKTAVIRGKRYAETVTGNPCRANTVAATAAGRRER